MSTGMLVLNVVIVECATTLNSQINIQSCTFIFFEQIFHSIRALFGCVIACRTGGLASCPCHFSPQLPNPPVLQARSVRLLVFGCFHPIWTLFGPVRLLKSSYFFQQLYWRLKYRKKYVWFEISKLKVGFIPYGLNFFHSFPVPKTHDWTGSKLDAWWSAGFLVIVYKHSCFYPILLFHPILLLTFQDVSTLYYYSALYYY